MRCPAPATEQGRYLPTGREAQSGWGLAPGIIHSLQGLRVPHRCPAPGPDPSPSQVHLDRLDVTEALDSRKCPPEDGLGSGFAKLLQPSSLDFLPMSPLLLPASPPCHPRAQWGRRPRADPRSLLDSSALASSLALASRPSGPKSPWPSPGPVLRPLGCTVAFCCQRRALKNCWHCQKPRVRYDSPNIPLFLLFC